MDILRHVIESASCFVEIMLCMYFFSAFKERRFSNLTTNLIALLNGCVYASVLWILSTGSVLFAISVEVTFFMALCYKFKWYISIFMAVIASAISALSELVVMEFITFSGMNFATANSNIYVYISGLLATKTFTYIIIILVHKAKHKSFQNIKNMKFAQLLLLPCATIAVSIVFSHYISFYNVSIFLKIISIVSLVILIISNVMIFNIIDAQYELINIKEKLKMSQVLMQNQKQYYEDAFKSQQEIRKTRHDLKNIFIAVLGELNSGNIDATKSMLQNKLEEMEQYIYVDDNSDNVIDAVIHSKERDAEKCGVYVEVQKIINRDIAIDDLDLAVLIANLLDNAIEATSKIDGERRIDFSFITDNENLIIISRNPTKNVIDGEKLQTTKSDSSKHGFGIMSINSIAEKYNGSFVWNCKNSIFVATIILPNLRIGI